MALLPTSFIKRPKKYKVNQNLWVASRAEKFPILIKNRWFLKRVRNKGLHLSDFVVQNLQSEVMKRADSFGSAPRLLGTEAIYSNNVARNPKLVKEKQASQTNWPQKSISYIAD